MIPSDVLDNLKSLHGDVWTVEAGPHVFAFKAPSQGAYDRCIGTMADNKKLAPSALRQLALDCIVHPSREEAAAIFAKRPGVASLVASDCLRVAGEEEAEKAKKA